MRLKHVISLSIFGPAALLLLATIVIVQQTSSSQLAQLNESRYAANLSILSNPVRDALLARDMASLDEQLLALLESPDIADAALVDLSGVVIASPDPRRLGQPVDLTDAGWRSREIDIAGRTRAVLHLQFDLSKSSKAIERVFQLGFALVIVVLFVLAGIAWWLGSSLARRIESLSSVARKMAEGELDARSELTGADEVAQLSSSINQMADQVQANLLKLSQSDQRTSLALEAGHMGIWVYDTSNGTVYMDGRLSELYGAPRPTSDYPLEYIINPVHPDDIELRASFIDQALLSDEKIEQQFRVIHDDGEVRWIRSQARALFTDTAARIVGIDQDVTHSVSQLEKIDSLRKELERSNKELEDFAHIASHDLKEPLRGMANYAQFLKEDYSESLDETANQYVDRMVVLAQNLSDMIADLLRMSRMSKVENDGKVAAFDDVCAEIRESLQFTIDEKNVTWTIQDNLGVVALDPANLRELVRNILVNGIKYNRSPSPLIELFFDESRGAYGMRDNGIGIRADQINDIFTPFRHLNSHDAFGRSTGLGMTIVKKIVDGCGGEITVDSEPDHGTTIWFTLPRVS